MLEGNKHFNYTISGVECNKRCTRLLQFAQRFFRLFADNLVKTWWIHLVNSPGVHNVCKITDMFIKFWEIQEVFYQVLEMQQMFTFGNSPGFHQVYTRFWNFTKFNPNFTYFKTHQFHRKKRKNASFGEFWRCKTRLCFFLMKIWWIHQVFTMFWKFTRYEFSSSFHRGLEIHQIFTRCSDFAPSLGDQSGGFRIASSFHCIWKKRFFRHHFQEKKRKKRFVLSLEHTKTLVDPWQTLRKQLDDSNGFSSNVGGFFCVSPVATRWWTVLPRESGEK